MTDTHDNLLAALTTAHENGQAVPCEADPARWDVHVDNAHKGRTGPPGMLRAEVNALATLCRSCPAFDACVAWAVTDNTWTGVVAGMHRDVAGLRNPGRPRTGANPCGTSRGYRQHLRHGEEACPPCRAAEARYRRAQRGKASA